MTVKYLSLTSSQPLAYQSLHHPLLSTQKRDLSAVMALYFKLTVFAVITLFLCCQQDFTDARPISYSYSDLQRMLEAIIQIAELPWKARLQENKAYDMGGHPPEVDAFEIEPGILAVFHVWQLLTVAY